MQRSSGIRRNEEDGERDDLQLSFSFFHRVSHRSSNLARADDGSPHSRCVVPMNELGGQALVESKHGGLGTAVLRQRRDRHVRGARSGRLDVSSVDLDHCSTDSSVSVGEKEQREKVIFAIGGRRRTHDEGGTL